MRRNKTLICMLAAALALLVGLPALAQVTFQGSVVSNDTLSVSAPFGGIVDERSARIDVLIVSKAGTDACALFHVNMVAGSNIGLDVVRCKSHTELVVLDLFYTSDLHGLYSSQIDCRTKPRTVTIINKL